MQHYDLIIVGGGLAGNCLALALKESGLNCALIEAYTPEQLKTSSAGDRALALAAGTVQVLDDLGAWQGCESFASPIKNIHISDKGHFGKTRLSAEKENVKALGYVITARDIETHVSDLVANTNTTRITPAKVIALQSYDSHIEVTIQQGDNKQVLSASLLVGADGGQSSIRQLLGISQQITDYQQTALVTTVSSTLAHHNTAFERFTRSGPLALLPLGTKQSAVVWTRRTDDANALMQTDETDFLAQLQDCFGYRLGKLSLAAPRRSFPLSLIRAEKMLGDRAVIIGNAVHQLHPVAGQGFNLGLRDVIELAERIKHHTGDLGDAQFLHAYANTRQKDHDVVIGFTNNVVKIFSNDWLPLAAARNVGLALLDHIPKAKSLLSHYAMGLHR
ncbi:2-octaprenyl-6-methoxyphenol hydroxylase [Patescibacteria group bacterium]|nr:2-octaprenyl-6-methoxyphenol hydroxylase [Patescibacteria group bacterium]